MPGCGARRQEGRWAIQGPSQAHGRGLRSVATLPLPTGTAHTFAYKVGMGRNVERCQHNSELPSNL